MIARMLRVIDLAKAYGETRVFERVSFEIGAGEFVVLIG